MFAISEEAYALQNLCQILPSLSNTIMITGSYLYICTHYSSISSCYCCRWLLAVCICLLWMTSGQGSMLCLSWIKAVYRWLADWTCNYGNLYVSCIYQKVQKIFSDTSGWDMYFMTRQYVSVDNPLTVGRSSLTNDQITSSMDDALSATFSLIS